LWARRASIGTFRTVSVSEVRSYKGKGFKKLRLALLGVIILGCKHWPIGRVRRENRAA
jgi:hypothetical protein